ncbi:MAG TPA: DUF5615 family PIN-like protein [Bryobacteraceae bacterium]|jgi:hypothetical protein|nr:DUF5615 family PIN-like protein [Bryobacteraceae bacterium]
MRPRFQADADFNHKILLGLRREPLLDFFSAHDGGVVGLADPDVLRIAAQTGRILVSHDRKTMRSHFVGFRETRSSPGLIIVSQDLDIDATTEDRLLNRGCLGGQ